MQIPIRMCDERLAQFVDVYGHWPMPMENISTFSPGLIAFNLSGSRIEVEGEHRPEPVLMGIATDPTHIRYSLAGGDIVSLRVLASTYDRLFDIDPSEQQGVVAMDPDKHPRVSELYHRLKAAPSNPAAWFATLDDALLDLLPNAKPAGLMGRMVALLQDSDRDWTVTELADQLGCTNRTLERACKRRFGRTPKRLLRGHRLNKTRQLEARSESRIELEPDFAYADLPHYLNDLRRMVGLNRTQLGDEVLQGLDFPYRYIWPDGRVAEQPDEIGAWHAEMERRMARYRG